MKKYKNILFSSIAFIVGVAFIGANYFYELAFSKKAFGSNIASQENSTVKKDYKQDYFEKNKRQLNLTSTTGYNLKGYEFVVDEKRPFIIVTHGYTTSAKYMGHYIYEFNKRNYNVLAPDLLFHGESEGKFITMGSYDSKDLRKWIDVISEKYNNPKIMLFGISMGAATVMNTLDENLPDNVVCFAQDSGYVSLKDELAYQAKKLYKIPYFPMIPVLDIVTKIRSGYIFEEVDATNSLKNTKLPALILHGDKDGFVPPYNAQKAYDLLNSQKYIYISKGAKHVEGFFIDYENYWKTMNEFLKKYLI